MSKNLHIVPHENEWAVKREGRPTPLSVHSSQREAVEAALDPEDEDVTGIVVHRPDGTIRSRRSIDHDAAGWQPSMSLVVGTAATVVALIAIGGLLAARSERRWF